MSNRTLRSYVSFELMAEHALLSVWQELCNKRTTERFVSMGAESLVA
jgi:hypothetical protein